MEKNQEHKRYWWLHIALKSMKQEKVFRHFFRLNSKCFIRKSRKKSRKLCH